MQSYGSENRLVYGAFLRSVVRRMKAASVRWIPSVSRCSPSAKRCACSSHQIAVMCGRRGETVALVVGMFRSKL